MKKINKKAILLLCLMCVFIVPKVKGIERIEENLFCITSFHQSIVENIEIEKGETITWDFTTYNSSFEASLVLWLDMYTHVADLCVQQIEHKGEYTFTQTGFYRITVVNFGANDGYIHIIIENKETSISGYPIILIIFFSILGLIVYKRKKLRFNIK